MTISRSKNIKVILETIKKTEFHINQELRLFFVLAGHLEILRNNENILLQAGDIYFVNHREIIALTGSVDNLVVVLTLPNGFLEKEQELIELKRPLAPDYFTATYHQLVKQLVSLLLELSKQEEGFDYLAQGHHQQIIGLVIRELPRVKNSQLANNGDISEKVTEIIRYINTHYQEDLPLAHLAETFYMNKYYLAHLFKEEVGLTVGHYLKEVRLLNSLSMLEHTEKSLTEIALANGFPSQRSFSHVFRELQGETPTEYLARQKTSDKKIDYVAKDGDIQTLLGQYLSVQEVTRLTTVKEKIVSQSIDLTHVQRIGIKPALFLKIQPENIWRYLPKATTELGIKLVSITNVSAKVIDQFGQVNYDQVRLELEQILQQKLTPYIQLSVQDYDVFVQSAKGSHSSFEAFMENFVRFIENNFENSQDWVIEFRCFYEVASGAELCLPMRESLTYFKDRFHLVIHFPVHPYEVAESEGTVEQAMVWVINDTGVIKELSYSLALENLTALKFIETIDKQFNRSLQQVILSKITEVEQDAYYQHYKTLINANQTLSLLLDAMNSRQQLMLPISLDGSSMFQYFPEELSKKFSLLDPRGVMQDVWYIYRFIYLLYAEVVYQDDYCLLTKKRDNYRLLVLQTRRNELIKLAQLRFDEDIMFNQLEKNESSLLSLKYHLQGLSGRYQIERSELSIETKLKQQEFVDFPTDLQLTLADVTYLNAVSGPIRRIEIVAIRDAYLLDLKLTPFSIQFVEFKKLSD